MLITVAICTWNRCQMLEQALAQMTRLNLPPEAEWELLVVNNNSTDGTDKVLDAFAEHLPLRRLFEPQQGLSHARNRALHEARGEYLLWTDDDVLVNVDWIAEYHRAFSQWPEAAFFGGPVSLQLAGAPPHWLQRVLPQVRYAFAAQDHGPAELPLSESVIPVGANYVVRTAVQQRYPYDPELGVRPGGTIRGEEEAVIRAMLQDGFSGRWVPQARVIHTVPAHRQTLHYLREYYFGLGEFQGRALDLAAEQLLFGKPRWLWRQAFAYEAKYRWKRLTAQPENWIEDLMLASHMWGKLRGCDYVVPASAASYSKREMTASAGTVNK